MHSIPAQTYDELPRDPFVTAAKAAGVATFLGLVAGLLWAADAAIAAAFDVDPEFADFIMAPWVAPAIIIGFVGVVAAVVALLTVAGSREDGE